MNLAAALMDVAQRQPEHPAVTEAGVTLTYAAFADRACRIGGALRARGLAPQDRVILWMENCSEFLESLFACWTAGLCAVPVNAKLHARELAHIVADSGARLLLTTPGLESQARTLSASHETPASIICTRSDAYRRLTRGEPVEPLPMEPTDLAWIFYTSGTTGRPKGAMLTCRNLLAMSLRYFADIDLVGPGDTKLHSAPLSHASGLYSLPFFLKGAHHVVLPGFDVEAVADALGRYRNVTLFAAPTMLTRLINSPLVTSLGARNLRTLYYGGGPMYVADLERALEIFGPRLYQVYGQGESPMTITGLSQALHGADGRPSPRERLASCGVARTGVSVKVVDEQGRELPPGAIGEVITRSDCMMRGYWNDPEATASTLKDAWLHTGDVGSFDEQGFLTLRDRSKDVIISGGSNIYPREVEEILLRHPDLIEVSVIGRPHPQWGEEVMAFVVLKPGRQVSDAALDALCLDHIARYKRPKSYRFIAALPKNHYGKVLKSELRRYLEQEPEQ